MCTLSYNLIPANIYSIKHKIELKHGRAHIIVDMQPSGKEQANFNKFVQFNFSITGYNSLRAIQHYNIYV